MIQPGEQGEGVGSRRRRIINEGEASTHTTPEDTPDGQTEELEDDEEEEQRSHDGMSEAEEADGDAARPSTSGTRTNSTSSTANDGNGGGSVPTKTQAAFVGKLWSMLCTPALSELIAWTDDGKAFTVFHPTEFARAVLPQFFKHSNFASFIRQLNMYGFGKRVNDALGSSISHMNTDGTQVQAWEFQNPAFQRDRPDLLAKIRRKSAKPSAVTVTALPSNRRRPSIVRGASSKSRRDANVSDGGDEDEEPAPRIGNLAQSAPLASSSLFGEGTLSPSNGAKVVAGLNDFTPHISHHETRAQFGNRTKEEPYAMEAPARSPTSYTRQYPSYPPPPPPSTSYYHAHPSTVQPSPRSQMYPLPPPNFYPNGRPAPTAEDPSIRQILALEAQVRTLGEALFHTQQEIIASRAASYSVLGMMLGIVADLDVDETRQKQIESCSSALSKLHPDAVYPSQPPAANQNYPSYPPAPNGAVPPPAHPSPYQHYNYNRIPPTESYTRSSRPDSAQSREVYSNQPPPPAPSASLPQPFRPSSTNQPNVRAKSPPRPTTSESGSAQPTPSGLAAQSSYPSWPTAPPGSNRPTSLPSLSSLLEGVPASGERRREAGERESEPPDERLRKKLRQ